MFIETDQINIQIHGTDLSGWITMFKIDIYVIFVKNYSKFCIFDIGLFSCPGSSIPDLGESLTATLECWHKEWLLRLETPQTFDQSDVWTKIQKYKKTKGQKYKKTKR